MDRTTLSIKEREEAFLLPAFAKYPLAIERGEGVYVWDASGRKYLDFYGGHAVCLLGHRHPRLLKALEEQMGRLLFYSASVYSSVRASAAETLVKFSGGDKRVFFSNSGAEANENSLKLARLLTGRKEMVSLEGSFHGRTVAALAVTGIDKYRKGIPMEGSRMARFGDLEDLRSKMDDRVAALIVEPIQSLSGVRQAPAEYFQEAAKICRDVGALFIADEIQTGLGRLGRPFWHSGIGVEPDIVSLAKGLAGGFPIGATVIQRSLAERVKMGELGSTFGGGPLACALLVETLDTLTEEKLVGNAEARGGELHSGLKRLGVEEVRGEGLLIGIRTKRPAEELVVKLLERGVLVGGSLDPMILRLLPPLTISAADVETFLENFAEVL